MSIVQKSFYKIICIILTLPLNKKIEFCIYFLQLKYGPMSHENHSGELPGSVTTCKPLHVISFIYGCEITKYFQCVLRHSHS